MSDKKKLLPRDGREIGCIIVDDLDDKDIAVCPAVVAERLKWVQSSLTYKEANKLVQKEYDEAYNSVVIPKHPLWDTLEYIAPNPCFPKPLNDI